MAGLPEAPRPRGEAFARGVVARRGWILVVWLVLVALAGWGAQGLNGRLYGSVGTLPGSESGEVEERMAREFDSPYVQFMLVTLMPSGGEAVAPYASAQEAAAVRVATQLRR